MITILFTIFALTIIAIFLLIIQGRWTRKSTVKLPEPNGARKGRSGKVLPTEGDTLKVLIIGDSSAAGVGVDHQDKALTGFLIASLANQFSVEWQLMAKTGFTCTELIKQLQQQPQPFTHIDHVIVAIGVNDVTNLTRRKQWQKNLVTLVDLLENQFHTHNIIFTAIPPMHLFTALPQPLRWILGTRAKQLNQLMAEIIQTKPTCHLLQPDIPFSEHYLADDKFHPSQASYKLWAEQAAQLIRKLSVI